MTTRTSTQFRRLIPTTRERGSIVLTKIKVWCAGFRDGWEQPYELASSTNVDVYDDTDEQWLDLQETLDYGINWGQTLRGGARSQADQEGYVPYGLRLRLVSGAVLLATAFPTCRHLHRRLAASDTVA